MPASGVQFYLEAGFFIGGEVCRFFFKKPKDLLSLYNALNDTDYTDVSDLTVTTLEDIVYNYKGYGLPCFETIRRARQRVQSLFPELSRQCTGCCCDVPDKLKIVIEVR